MTICSAVLPNTIILTSSTTAPRCSSIHLPPTSPTIMFARSVDEVEAVDYATLCPKDPTKEAIDGYVQGFKAALKDRPEITDEFREEARAPTIATIMRFVRARKYDVEAAVQQFVDAEVWYHENDVASALDTDPDEEVYQAFCPVAPEGFDKHGRPIYWERTGEIRLPKVLKLLTEEKLVRRHVRQQENAVRRMQVPAPPACRVRGCLAAES
ncbi:hypothetical protein PTSG_05566 [Salpingoeca rosetta]|uniref:CRAL/TRIO N-terminal domain-containing protein n=1 Tax=Salpingoeca rosetta (strain ATCC 50818 / BSB-021) TaxID=946362 RepID=F2UBK5_SALR5|nr:uncharacterized protein PTSG_05566 [Salpingoeca rosetta]EGD73871.1 hypothetical protein PTSG_05566 [Salpingoeca rosetta]|eukprot:XP_004993434.1 hypothetical protein PTSG_05566 [Salpingoeca rosetta]